jgi:hypothetical protein
LNIQKKFRLLELYRHNLSGFTYQGRPLHIVCGELEDERILVITAYEPSSEEWEEDWKNRR